MRLLKKYPNRRIYDTELSRFITVDDVRRMVLDGQSFQVVDSRSGDDLTRATLLQVITEMEAQGQESLLTNRVLEELIRFYGNSANGFLRGLLEQSICSLLEQKNLFQGTVKQAIDSTNPVPLVTGIAKRYADFWRGVLVPGRGRGGDAGGEDDRAE